MMFLVTWEFVDSTEAGEQASLNVFWKWQPGPATFQGFCGYADGTGGCAIVEADDAASLARTTAPWTPWLRFSAKVLLPIEESAASAGEAIARRAANS